MMMTSPVMAILAMTSLAMTSLVMTSLAMTSYLFQVSAIVHVFKETQVRHFRLAHSAIEEVRSVASSHTYKQVGRVSWLGEQDMK